MLIDLLKNCIYIQRRDRWTENKKNIKMFGVSPENEPACILELIKERTKFQHVGVNYQPYENFIGFYNLVILT